MTLLLLGALAAAPDPALFIDQLGAETIQEREQAEASLRDLGPDILPALRKASSGNPSAEVRLRIARVIRYLTQIRWSPTLAGALQEASRQGIKAKNPLCVVPGKPVMETKAATEARE